MSGSVGVTGRRIKPTAKPRKMTQIPGSALTPFINNELFPAWKEIDASDSPTKKVIKQVFEDSNNYMKNRSLMLAVIEKLEEAINFHDFKTRAHLGDVYEQLLNDWRADEKVDCLITNPTFGGYEDDGVGTDHPGDLKTRETADMFMALIIKKLLKDNGGRGAVVLPDGTMFGASKAN